MRLPYPWEYRQALVWLIRTSVWVLARAIPIAIGVWLAITLSSCAPPLLSSEPEPWQGYVDERVWFGVYAQEDDPPPVVWIRNPSMFCGDGDGTILNTIGKCVGGFSTETPTIDGSVWQVVIGLSSNEATNQLRYVHELAHVACPVPHVTNHPVECFGTDQKSAMVGAALAELGIEVIR